MIETGEMGIPNEDPTRPRWRCPVMGEVEYCRPTDKTPQAAERRLRRRIGGAAGIEYRAGVIVGRVGHGRS